MLVVIDRIFTGVILIGGIFFGLVLLTKYAMTDGFNFLSMPNKFTMEGQSWPAISTIYFITGIANLNQILNPSRITNRLCILVNIVASAYAIALASLSLPYISVPAWINTAFMVIVLVLSVFRKPLTFAKVK